MIFAVVGSRTFNNYKILKATLDEFGDKIQLIVSGGADGADDLAYRYAKENSIVFRMYPAKWKEFGKSAGFKRNVLIALDCDIMVAFHNNNSRGTAHAISKARQFNKPVMIIKDTGEVEVLK